MGSDGESLGRGCGGKIEVAMKITRLTKRFGKVKNLGNYESLRVENELEAEIEDGESLETVNKELTVKLVELMKTDLHEKPSPNA